MGDGRSKGERISRKKKLAWVSAKERMVASPQGSLRNQVSAMPGFSRRFLKRAIGWRIPGRPTRLEYMDRLTGRVMALRMSNLVFINWRTGEPAKNSPYDTHLTGMFM